MGRARGRAGKTTGVSRQPKQKRSAPVDSDGEQSAPKKAKTTKEKAPIEPRAPSSRTAANDKPPAWAPLVPRTNRTHEEVQAEKDRIAAAAEDRECQRRELMAKIAAIDAATDQAAAEEEANAVLTLDDVQQDEDTFMTFTESDFERVDDDESYHSGEESEPVKKKKAVVKRPKRPKKRETRSEIEAMAKTMGEKGKGKADVAGPAVKKKALQNSDAAAASKKAGMSKAYLAHSAKTPQAALSPGKLEYGGLTEEDAISARPDFDATAGKPQRVNDLRHRRHADQGTGPAAPRPAPRPRTAPKVKTESKIPALSIASDKKTTVKQHVKVKTESSPAGFTPDTSSDVRGLPALVGATWDSQFLPAAYRALYCSPEPMTFAVKGENRASELAAIRDVQQILDSVHPGNTLVISWADKICSRAVSRVRERRTRISQVAAGVVKKFFETDAYRNRPIAIRAYAQYAVRPDGPAFFRIPTPENIPCDPRLDNYIPGVDYMESTFIIQTVTAYISTEEFVLPQPGPDGEVNFTDMPGGLFALAAAGVERAFNAYTDTGVHSPPPKFSIPEVGTAVAGYSKNISRFTRRRWGKLLDACGAQAVTCTAPPKADVIVLDGIRDAMYIPSSP
ncbi:hypothetical protein B0H13DRAFT_2567478 [Mycena leptocephala]|nr:hypothetical protein B0H13DRAFT_2567478 [Mycena leptocephala]